ncbi:MAG: hypothetical protein ABWY06_05255 [Pseudomonas sp.]|uniref:hypothetical protein n=1 Tax=Pseudomonas sp. TaxID=306 RepID=UPI003391FC6B
MVLNSEGMPAHPDRGPSSAAAWPSPAQSEFALLYEQRLQAVALPIFERARQLLNAQGVAAHVLHGTGPDGLVRVALCVELAGVYQPEPAQHCYCIKADRQLGRVVYEQRVEGESTQFTAELASLNETVLNTELGRFLISRCDHSIDLLAEHKIGF